MASSLLSSISENPPASNRGVTSPLYVSIDWLRVSFPWPDGASLDASSIYADNSAIFASRLLDALRLSETGLSVASASGGRSYGYSHAFALSPSGMMRFSPAYQSQKISIEFTGRDLDGLLSASILPVNLLEKFLLLGARVRRLDVAVDLLDSGADVLDIYKCWQAGEVVTQARRCWVIAPVDTAGNFTGKTVYIGSRTSEKFLRVYDKSLERSDVSGASQEVKDWIRAELETKDDYSQLLAWSLIRVENWRSQVQATLLSFVDMSWLQWKYITGGITANRLVVGRKQTDRFRWLMEQVLPAFKSELEEQELAGDWSLYDAFNDALMMMLNRSKR